MVDDWIVKVDKSANSLNIFDAFDVERYNNLRSAFDLLETEQKSSYKGIDEYIEKNGGPHLSPGNKRYQKLKSEIHDQMKSNQVLEMFPIDILDYDVEIQDLLSSLENENHLKKTYRTKKLQVKKSGINSSDVSIVIECIRQGRSLLQAGAKADMLAKPLIDFYAACAYAFAIVVMNSPLHKSIDSLKGSHGHTYNHNTKTIDFGGDIPSGTFTDLITAFPCARVSKFKGQQISFKYSTLPSIDFIQHNSVRISLVPLLSMVPELSTYFDKLESGHRSVYKLNIDTGSNGSDLTYNFYVGDGVHKPDYSSLSKSFGSEQIVENHGSYVVSVPSNNINNIMPTIYQDLYGDFWYVENPVNELYLPEICLHYLIISGLCNIMRYSPHEWSNILTNRISSQFSLVVNQYVRIFERKFPLLAAQCLSNYNPYLVK